MYGKFESNYDTLKWFYDKNVTYNDLKYKLA